ncbi:MAG: type I-U CRISPR-associated helicase/endonuclease Cas3 [Acidimicrobiales bacterium]|nr:type I-U CRISPR-associated helicase/endonuclease Cas3 [Acidimicrobiales bacterium]
MSAQALVSLDARDFPSFFEELWDYQPFPWQRDLVAEASARNALPSLLDLPTGTGKTSIIDIAIFLLALDATAEPSNRWMPRRVVTVVDRRVIVDQVVERAERIAKKLHHASTDPHAGVLANVAHRLRRLAGTDPDDGSPGDTPTMIEPPLLVAPLRGGTTRDESWMRRPDVPAIVSSTIDQAGSRLLFRGYGISRSMRPVHAGLLGNDALWILDEVHLARPFAQTLGAIRSLRQWRTGGGDLPNRWGVIEMSATPTDRSLDDGGLSSPGDVVDDSWRFPGDDLVTTGVPTLSRRLAASKPARLVDVSVPANPAKADERFARHCARAAEEQIEAGIRTLAVIVNRVDTARRVNLALRDSGATVVLLTGRMRPLERDRILHQYRDRLRTGRQRDAHDESLVVVSTQAIEAGADLDFDSIITEAASLDSLRQRFGRVDRDGQVASAGPPPMSVILARSSDLKPGTEDPIYGDALRETWRWLEALPELDFGHGLLPDPDPETLTALVPPAGRAPRLLPTHLDQLAQTSHPIQADPDVSRWLHGERPAQADVHLVWRSDLDEEFIVRMSHLAEESEERTEMIERLTACPPSPLEMLPVPINAARKWLNGQAPTPINDVEGSDDDTPSDSETRPRPWISWTSGTPAPIARGPSTGRDRDDQDRAAVLRPGGVIVVPSHYGGITAGTWDPAGTEPVSDLATGAHLKQGRRVILRLHPGMMTSPHGEALFCDHELPTEDDCQEMSRRELRNAALEVVEAIDASRAGEDDRRAREMLIKAPRSSVSVLRPLAGGFGADASHRRSIILSAQLPESEETSILSGPTSNTDPEMEASSFTGAGVGLQEHLQGVGNWSRYLAEGLGLEGSYSELLELAGRLHDLGKADTRFQVLLHHGDEVAAAGAPLLAKSKNSPATTARRGATDRSGYPKGARHELTSLALGEVPIEASARPDLVAHLVASHHGWCRPFAPPSVDPSPVDIDVEMDDIQMTARSDHGLDHAGAGAPDRFADLNREYGWFHLAWLEAILRLGDHRRSEFETRSMTNDRSSAHG